MGRREQLQELLGERLDVILGLQQLDGADADPSLVIYVAGSLVEGFGHATSDVDVFVVGDHHARGGLHFEILNYEVAVDFGEHRRLDYEYWPSAEVDGLAAKLDGLDLGRGFLAVLHDSEEVFVHRLRTGVAVTDDEAFRRVQARFDFTRLQRYLTTKAIREVDNVLDDLTGLLQSGHLDAALFRAVDLVGFTVDVFTHHSGNTNPYRKWRLAILERLPADGRRRQVLEGYWRFSFPPAVELRADADACRRHVVACMELANTVTDWAQP